MKEQRNENPLPPKEENNMRADIVITKKLRQLAVETPHSIDDLAAVKYHYDLTDDGVSLVAYNASRNAISLYDTITRMQVLDEYGLGAKLRSTIYGTYY